MSEEAKKPTHYRLVTALKAIGPYLREPLCKEGAYHFDCLSVCVDDSKSPEDREFWGWWLDLSIDDAKLEATYQIGRYNQVGEWVLESAPKAATAEITRTQEVFHEKLTKALNDKFKLSVEIHDDSVEFV
ncbi:sigma factor-binding protein Crl [Vibrio sp. ZSDZ65]|uniref:Sigma factor-binding protein Crl n=1 Tax=Vibrio qingdaonensis TaxID=2829491 RepID=A0A9X3HXH7_9VIBR|nr:sigma factor-binding protein Crl [Vibrio qingdaonensis]MCW8347273.1 sigma factor-binding protein Crl [Vibrio qingdaonensis]